MNGYKAIGIRKYNRTVTDPNFTKITLVRQIHYKELPNRFNENSINGSVADTM